MQIVTRSLQTVSQALAFTGQKLSQIDGRIAKAAAFIFAAAVLYVAYRKISAMDRAVVAEFEDARNELNATVKLAKRMLTLSKGGIEAAILKSKELIHSHLRPIHYGERDYVHTLGDDKRAGLKLPAPIANIFNFGKWWFNKKKVENPFAVYKLLVANLGEDRAIRCINVCADSAWKPSLAPIIDQISLQNVTVNENNVVTINGHIFKIITVKEFFHKNGGERASHVMRIVELDVRDLDRDDGKIPSLKVDIQYPKIN